MPDADQAEVERLLQLRPHRWPSRPVPRLLRRLLPDPTTEGGWARFTHADLPELAPAARRHEAFRLRVAAALVDDAEVVPLWVVERLRRLEVA